MAAADSSQCAEREREREEGIEYWNMMCFHKEERLALAGPLMQRPEWSKMEPWQGQSKVASMGFHFTMHFMWGHTAATASWQRNISSHRLKFWFQSDCFDDWN